MLLKKFIISLTFFWYLISNTNSIDLDKNLSINEVKPNLFVVTHSFPWSSNSLIVIMQNNDILLIDTPYTPSATYSLLNWINKTYGKRNILAINTHFHIDRLGGNEALIKSEIPIYSSELTIATIKERGQQSINLLKSWIKDENIKQYYQNFKYISPTKIFDSTKGLILNFGNENVEIKYYGIGHSVDNLVVYLPNEKTIFGGCLILSMDAKEAGNASDGNINDWIKTIEKIDTINYDLIIPGHGKEGGIELLKYTKNILKISK
ncbi:MAG TPA: MBL fold metallo-hydrolase [Spirochaetota bacterium]|nr:MBL fold metallo-hydrolase [Spirochaetota bacterium]